MATLAEYFLPDPKRAIEAQRELTLLALCVWGEARGESNAGKSAVAHVVMNRWRSSAFPRAVRDVILQPAQFSSFNADDPNRKKMLGVKAGENWNECFNAALGAYGGIDPDPTRGATHYCGINSNPGWRKLMIETARIGGHVFMRPRK